MLDSAALSWKREAISKTLPLLYLRIHCASMTVRRGTAVSNVPTLELIAAIPGKGLTKGLLLRRTAECATVTSRDECLSRVIKLFLFFFFVSFGRAA